MSALQTNNENTWIQKTFPCLFFCRPPLVHAIAFLARISETLSIEVRNQQKAAHAMVISALAENQCTYAEISLHRGGYYRIYFVSSCLLVSVRMGWGKNGFSPTTC